MSEQNSFTLSTITGMDRVQVLFDHHVTQRVNESLDLEQVYCIQVIDPKTGRQIHEVMIVAPLVELITLDDITS